MKKLLLSTSFVAIFAASSPQVFAQSTLDESVTEIKEVSQLTLKIEDAIIHSNCN